MKKIIIILLSVLIITAGSPVITFAHVEDLYFHEAFVKHGSVIIISDAYTGKILHANKAASDFYGYSIAELETMSIQDLNTLSMEEMDERLQDISEGDRHDFILEHRLANGEVRTVEVKSYPYTNGNQKLVIGIVNDITRKTKLEKEESVLITVLLILIALLCGVSLLLFRKSAQLRAQHAEISGHNELRKTFIDSYDNLIYLKDENLKYIFCNKGFTAFFNKKESDILGHEDSEFSDTGFSELQRKSDFEVLKMKTVREEINWNNRIYRITKFPVKLASGYYGVGAYIDDVTEATMSKRMVEKNLHRSQILVDVMSTNFNTAEEQLDYTLNEALKLTESKLGYIYLYDEESREFTLNSWSRDVMDECRIEDKKTKYQLDKTGLWGEVIRQRKPIVVNDFRAPNPMKKGYPKGHVQLTRFMSVPVFIEDKIVAVVGLANKDYDYDNNDVYQVIALMNGVWHAKERREALVDLAIERNKFLQTLISIGDAVLVVDMEGRVTMLNRAAEKLTGWITDEAFGRDYREVFVLSHEDERCSINDPIADVMKTDTVQELGNHAVLTSKSGKKYYIEDSAAPIKDDKDNSIGIVLVFRDVTEKKEQRRRIEYLSFHDSMTGLYNRMFFEEELKRLDTARNLPLSIIVCDMNGLKLTNDIFGHEAGDLLLRKLAEVFKKVCRADDIIARVGGDEFTILLPRTTEEDAMVIIDRVRSQFSKERVKAIKGSVSMGCSTKTNMDTDILLTLRVAEERMYAAKTTDREDVKATTIGTIVETLHKSSPKEAEHSTNVSGICESIGMAMGLSEVKIRKVKEAGYLHDIGKIVISEKLANKYSDLTDQEQKELAQHPITGYRILNSFDNTLDLAESILAHHEKWDGSGYPKGLKGMEIPLSARIIAVADRYDVMTSKQGQLSSEAALGELEKKAGTEFDPIVVNAFVKIMAQKSYA